MIVLKEGKNKRRITYQNKNKKNKAYFLSQVLFCHHHIHQSVAVEKEIKVSQELIMMLEEAVFFFFREKNDKKNNGKEKKK